MFKEIEGQPLRLPVIHPRCVTGCSCAPGKPASGATHWARLQPPDADPIDDGDSLASVLSAHRRCRRRAHAEQTRSLLLATLRGYYRREDKPFWWAHFDRLNYPADEWSDSTDVFPCQRGFGQSSTGICRSRASRSGGSGLPGELARGDLNGLPSTNPRRRRATDNPDRAEPRPAAVVETDDPHWCPLEVVIVERTGSDGNTFPAAPARAPAAGADDGPAIDRPTAAAVASGSPHRPAPRYGRVASPSFARAAAPHCPAQDPVTDTPRRFDSSPGGARLSKSARRTPRPG